MCSGKPIMGGLIVVMSLTQGTETAVKPRFNASTAHEAGACRQDQPARATLFILILRAHARDQGASQGERRRPTVPFSNKREPPKRHPCEPFDTLERPVRPSPR